MVIPAGECLLVEAPNPFGLPGTILVLQDEYEDGQAIGMATDCFIGRSYNWSFTITVLVEDIDPFPLPADEPELGEHLSAG